MGVEQLKSKIKNVIVPVLRDMGFKGSFPHFYRQVGNTVDLLTLQMNKYGGSFVVEISFTDTERRNVYIDKDVTPSKLRVSQTAERLRLGSDPENGIDDHWFECAEAVIPHLENQAISWWESKRDK